MDQKTLTILAIDDDPGDLRLYRRHLEKIEGWNAKLVCAEDAESAFHILNQCLIDVVLLDHQLGAENGLNLLKSFQSEGAGQTPPIVMVTGQGDESLAANAIKSGATDYISKNSLTAANLERTILSAYKHSVMQAKIEAQRKELERFATHDHLTGLLNRRVLMDMLVQEIARAGRYESELCVMLIDLDHFKQVNDSHGHIVGDHVLAQSASVIRNHERTTDISARYGGEEFCVVLPETDLAGAEIMANRLRETMAAQIYYGIKEQEFSVTCCVGIAQWKSADNVNLQGLLQRADEALYRAKDEGRNCVRLQMGS